MSVNLQHLVGFQSTPLQLGNFDHYTLIVEDAKAVARFHCEVLGFKHLRIQNVNAGSAPDGEYDMLNYVLRAPEPSGHVVVITEGLNENSIFCRYLRTYGAGIHHVAYQVDDLDKVVAQLGRIGIDTTSAEVLRDPLTGLRQVFIERKHGGYFIELIERTEQSKDGTFTHDNMARLAQTMEVYLGDPVRPAPEQVAPEVEIARDRASVIEFLVDPFNLPLWTAHKTVRRVDGRVVEVRMAGDLALEIAEHPTRPEVHFVWSRAGGEFRVSFAVESVPGKQATRVRAMLPELPLDRAARTFAVISAELAILRALLEQQPERITAEQRALVDEYHLEVYQRRGL